MRLGGKNYLIVMIFQEIYQRSSTHMVYLNDKGV